MKDNEPEIDESLLTPGQKAELEKPKVGKGWWIFWGVLLALIAFCIVMIVVLQHALPYSV